LAGDCKCPLFDLIFARVYALLKGMALVLANEEVFTVGFSSGAQESDKN
jgi:hypothetical protein